MLVGVGGCDFTGSCAMAITVPDLKGTGLEDTVVGWIGAMNSKT